MVSRLFSEQSISVIYHSFTLFIYYLDSRISKDCFIVSSSHEKLFDRKGFSSLSDSYYAFVRYMTTCSYKTFGGRELSYMALFFLFIKYLI